MPNFEKYESWGRYPKLKSNSIIKPIWKSDSSDLNNLELSLLPRGYGRSYGDSCQNDNNILIDTTNLNHLISFDDINGIVHCEAGVLLSDLLNVIVPRGWFLPVSPGTKFVSIAGAIANDIHGKNHHARGTFGCHVISFLLKRSDLGLINCSPYENTEIFNATIGGLGLTGLILSAKFQCIPIKNELIDQESIKFSNIDEFFAINEDSEKDYEYTVSWIDCTQSGNSIGKGVYFRGNHNQDKLPNKSNYSSKRINFPFDYPFINQASVKAFNLLYYNKQLSKKVKSTIHYDPFFYPLDLVLNWNKAYGKNGFLQYQFVLPESSDRLKLKEILNIISKSGESSFLTVLKRFGNIKSPGLLSFPREGITMTVDFKMKGQKVLDMLNELDNIIMTENGALYPAKDARMSKAMFEKSFPNLNEFKKYLDPKFSSSFWSRVNQSNEL